jgi:hypothetical protein
MAIHFIPNDPRAGADAPALRSQTKRPTRPASRSGFTLSNTKPEGVAAPGSQQFLFWQCREAAIAALDAWELSDGPHTRWQGNRKKLQLLQDEGEDLNAYYDRQSFSFFHATLGGDTFFSGASTDVVAHEVGHGLLDGIRPDLWAVNFLEVGAFHEAFGDCIAILTALADKESRQKLLAVTTTLRKKNFVSTTAEDLSLGIKRFDPTHNAAEPRHAHNNFQYQLPQTLPNNGGPGDLINESHSFGMLFSGCFWELIANLFAAAPAQNEANLAKAATLAGKILVAGTRNALVSPRFLQSVGRAMVLADQSLHAGANRDHIRNAFQAHNILLGSNAIMAPSMALAGAAPSGPSLAAATSKDLRTRLRAGKDSKLSTSAVNFFGTPAVSAVNTRPIPLSSVDKRLKGVTAIAHEPVLVGASGGRAAVMGAMPNPANTESEVQEFVKALLDQNRILLDAKKKAKSLVANLQQPVPPTHEVKTVGGKKVLARIRFSCGC